MNRRELEEKLCIKIKIEPIKGCWFIGNRDWSIYTTIKKKSAHRLVYEMCVGPLIVGREICHKCDRRGCINPDHLFQGTHSENMKDAINKGKLNHYKFKSKQSDLKKLRELHNWGQLRRFTWWE